MDEQLLNQINKNLYDVQSLISSRGIRKALEKYKIDVTYFLEIIELYISEFNLLKEVKNNNLLTLLNEKLLYIINNNIDASISLYHMQLEASMNFIQKHSHSFFNQSDRASHTIYISKSSITTKEFSTIDSVHIADFFSIREIKLDNLKEKKEIYIVGENGDGKSLLLQAITIAIRGVKDGDIVEFLKSENKYGLSIPNVYNLFAYGSARNNNCQVKYDETGYLTLFNNSLDLLKPTDWLIELFNAEKSKKKTIISVDEAKELLKMLLNRDIDISITYNKVVFSEKGSPVFFDQLSAGYKGVITIICDLINRIDKAQPSISAISKFKGTVLIDEVELHLHPKWKYNFMKKLRDTFPMIQFIVTTHSPTVILGASKEAVFYKIYKEDGEVQISNQIANEGYTHNSLVSSPLFDLDSITSRDYEKQRVSSDDYVYDKIHQVISERIKKDINTSEDEIMKLINEELDKL
ncbi:MAG TPA: hypothetical protein EYG80_05085 [Flavobacteriaceae bacterium]|nr:hypothetical protein [Flavobacteriaceae bacterium]